MTGDRTTLRAASARPRARPTAKGLRGFTFIELVVVMGAMGILLGLAVGYIGNIGQATFIIQAKGMLSETAYRCLSASIGDRRAILTLRRAQDADGDLVLRLGAAVARPVLTHQFETIDFASEARAPLITGDVQLARGQGRVGNCAKFGASSHLAFAASSVFAMTEGIELDVWVKPEAGVRQMAIMEGAESYGVFLTQVGDSDAYDVKLVLKLRKVSEEGRTAPFDQPFETKGAPVVADGRWSHIQVGYDGLDASIRVNGLEAYEPAAKRRAPGDGPQGEALVEQLHRLVVPVTGLVALSISSAQSPYRGLMDSFRLMGVFRSDDLERDLPGSLEVIYPAIPLRMVFRNGGLDPDEHSSDQIIRLLDTRNPDDPPLRLTIGMYGTISSFMERPGQGGPDARNPRLRGKRGGDGEDGQDARGSQDGRDGRDGK